jgi:hypothetical protein
LPKRKANSPWGSSYKEGLPTTSVNDAVEIDQMIRPMLDCGVISKETGQWEGVPTTDEQMIGLTINLSVANGATILVPDTNAYPSINMKGFSTLFIAIKPSNAGNYAITAVMGPDTQPFGGLSPVAAARTLRGGGFPAMSGDDMDNVLLDAGEDCQANVWNIFVINQRVKEQRNLQFVIENSTGGSSDIEFAFMRCI